MKKWIITWGGVGLIPGMPGTYASLASAALFYVLLISFGVSAYAIAAAIAVLAGLLAYWLYPWTEEYFEKADPSHFVLDEVVGQLLALVLIFLLAIFFEPLGIRPLAQVAAGFIFFRAFDVAKPWPIREIEKIPGAMGVILDDVVGALYAAVAVVVLVYVVRTLVGAEMYDKTNAFISTALMVARA